MCLRMVESTTDTRVGPESSLAGTEATPRADRFLDEGRVRVHRDPAGFAVGVKLSGGSFEQDYNLYYGSGAMADNSAGGTVPSSGCRQRRSAANTSRTIS